LVGEALAEGLLWNLGAYLWLDRISAAASKPPWTQAKGPVLAVAAKSFAGAAA